MTLKHQKNGGAALAAFGASVCTAWISYVNKDNEVLLLLVKNTAGGPQGGGSAPLTPPACHA